MSPYLIIGSILLGLALIFLLFSRSSSSTSLQPSNPSKSGKSPPKKPTSIVLYGQQSSGKTSLLTKFLTNEFLPCYTSQFVNEVVVEVELDSDQKKSVSMIDVPGAKVVRDTSQLARAKALLFLVDAFNFQVDTVALVLYEVLANRSIIENKVPVLMLCNKADIMLTTKSYLKKKLEKEMQRLWMARRNETMDSIVDNDTDEAQQTLLLKSVDHVFSFDETCQNEIEFMEVSVKEGKNMNKVKNWIFERM